MRFQLTAAILCMFLASSTSLLGRALPDTTNGIHVFNDQLSTTMSEEQVQFAASHYDGVQKMTRSDADRLRMYNPDFIILHYRLGLGLGYRTADGSCNPTGDWIAIIEGDNWVTEWPGEPSVSENWFYHWPEIGTTRVYNCDWGWYLMNPDNSGWRSYYAGEVFRQIQANDDDGVFADSFSVPNFLGYDHYNPALPELDNTFETAWGNRLNNFMSYLQTGGLAPYYLIVNVGQWVTSRDTVVNYSLADGVMIEGLAGWGYANYFDLSDWQLQMDRILGLVNLDRAILTQQYVSTDDVNDRMFVLGCYLLIKGSHTYLNLELDADPEWFPEYDIPIGSPTGSAPTQISDLWNASWGVYARTYSNGLVLVNPTDTPQTVNLGGTYYRATPQGGGGVPENGDVSAWRVTYAAVTSVQVPSNRAVVLLNQPYASSVQGWTTVTTAESVAGLLLYGDKSATGQEMGGLPGSVSASTAHYLAHFASTARWYTGVVVANPNVTAAHVTFKAYSESGSALGTANQTVPGWGKSSALVTQLFSPVVSGTGWIEVTSDMPVVVFDLYGDTISGGIGALSSSELASSLILPHFVLSTRWWTGITVLNPSTSSVSVTLKAYDSSGILLGQNTSSISARSKRVGMVEALIPEAANHSGWISVASTGGPVGGLLVYGDRRAVPNRIAAMPAIPAPYAYTELTLSSFFSDPEWWTGISLVNPSTTTSATLTLTAYAPDGTQIDQSSQSLPALNKTVGMVNTLFNLDTSTRGWVRVTSTSSIIGMEILNADDPGEQAWGLAAVEAQFPGPNLFLPHQVVSSRWWTLLSLANPNSSTASAGLTALNDDGTVLKATTKSIGPWGNIADYFKHLFGL